MKKLIIMRHAKSCWKDTELTDHERPLKKRGINDAKMMGKLLKSKKIMPDVIICSTAKRAKETADSLIEGLKYKNGVVYDKSSGLEWVAGPDKKTDWNEARRWVSNLNTDGGDWRMPSRNELRALYRKGAGSRNMTPLLASSGWYVWIEGKKAWDFYENFRSMYSNLRNNTESARAFAVRSRK